MKCLKTDKYTTLLTRLNSLMSPVGTLDELTEYLELCYKLVDVKKCDVLTDLVKLKERYLKDKDKLVHYQLVSKLIEVLEEDKYEDSRHLFNNFYRLSKPDENNYYIVNNILKRQGILEETLEEFKTNIYDKDLSKEDNIILFINKLSEISTNFIMQHSDVPMYVTTEFLEYCVHTYIKEYFEVVLKVTDKLEYESLEVRIKR